ncbi:MAG: hypothetical protein GF320_21050 [Armatimonadia bacterium]|nr:hypothetical protein [Armatimonadia bacterium]
MMPWMHPAAKAYTKCPACEAVIWPDRTPGRGGAKMHSMASDLIAQVATAAGEAALAVIRISGPGAARLMGQLFRPYSGQLAPPRTAMVGALQPPGETEPVDEAVVVLYGEGASYTGEEMAEITCHGGLVVVEQVLEMLRAHGARPAAPGEFSKRAYLNGKLDLSQAEAICDLIQSRTRSAARASLRSSAAASRIRSRTYAIGS